MCNILEIDNLSIGFETDTGTAQVTDQVCLQIKKGEIYGLVGESGCGKTITALSILKLLPVPGGKILEGSITFNDIKINELNKEQIKTIRGSKISMIFQEPQDALNPLLTIKQQMMECFDYHSYQGNKINRIKELLKIVGLTDFARILNSYPHELSGGMLQRVMIAMSLLLEPQLIIADEPTTALDVTIQAQIMELLASLRQEFDTSILLITHNLGLIAQYAERLTVMYAGRMVEESPIQDFLDNPLHPYTQGLINAIPDIETENSILKPIKGQVPQPRQFAAGCRFRERCPFAFGPCVNKPKLIHHSKNHKTACFLYEKN